ncbi:hypothetical protein MMC34_008761 [Xylographa carneopallida]|nr:hypothetical protein [Xylographa carneopallida]
MTICTRLLVSPPARRLLQHSACRAPLRSAARSPFVHSLAASFSTSSSAASNSDEMEEDDATSSSSSASSLPALPRQNLKPSELVAELDRHIVGQQEAKRAVAVALRNRYRRHQLPASMKADVTPRNILMLGPTGCGQHNYSTTQHTSRQHSTAWFGVSCLRVVCHVQARPRSLVGWQRSLTAHLLKSVERRSKAHRDGRSMEFAFLHSLLSISVETQVEATKFTEVGFYGKDVDSIIKDLARLTVPEMKAKRRERYKEKVSGEVEEAILGAILSKENTAASSSTASTATTSPSAMSTASTAASKPTAPARPTREEWKRQLRAGELESYEIEIEVPPPSSNTSQSSSSSSEGQSSSAVIVQILSGSTKPSLFSRTTRKLLPISEARPILTDTALSKLMTNEDLSKLAVKAIEEDGIVFLDEIDKICSPSSSASFRSSADASAEGVQRDLLPLIEGSAVHTSIGVINTDHILFICSGAFHSVKPSDLLPELQGRLPIKVELKGLLEEDLHRILTVPVNNLIMQQVELLKAEEVVLQFSDEAVREIAKVAAEVNRTVENIGARRLNTIIARIVDDISYQAADMEKGTSVRIERQDVQDKVKPLLEKADLSRYIL